MQHEFVNDNTIAIDALEPNSVRSEVIVDLTGGSLVDGVEVRVDLDHTWTNDLVLRLIDPGGAVVVLSDRHGGSGDDYRDTTFRATAATSIASAEAPFTGAFRPDGDLGEFVGRTATGTWTLEVQDAARRDGGALNSWTLGLDLQTTQVASSFAVDVEFGGGLTPGQQAAFASAASRWSEIIVGDLPAVSIGGQPIDDVLVVAEGKAIDGPGRILGQAGPTHLRNGSMLPARGVMSFDTGDLAAMEANGQLRDVILHEMAHVIGFGTLWDGLGLIDNAGTANPTFNGANARREYATLIGVATPRPVPLANEGGPGTADSHLRESVFGDELLTGFISGSVRPISRLSIAILEDMGYEVDYDAADAYELPDAFLLAEMGVHELHREQHYTVERPVPEVLPA